MRLRDLMTSDVRVVRPETTLRELAEFFVDEGVSGAPVVSGRRVVGVVSATDLLEFDAEGRMTPVEPGRATAADVPGPWEDEVVEEDETLPAAYFAEIVGSVGEVRARLAADVSGDTLDDHAVAEIMTRGLLWLGPEADVRDAAKEMQRTGVHRLLVMEDEELLGLVTTSDIVRAVAERGLGGD